MSNKEIDASYGPGEDVAAFISVEAASADHNAVRPDTFQLHGPGVIGCQNHDKTIMLSYTENEEHLVFHDLYLNATTAAKFLADIDQVLSKGQKPVISFQNTIDGEKRSFLLEGQQLEWLITRIGFERDDISSHIESHRSSVDDEPIPARRIPPTEAQMAAARKAAADYYHFEPRDVSLEGIDTGLLLAALYNNAKTGGMGSQHYRDELMTPAEGRHIFNELTRIGALHEIDYINGRSIKCWFGQTEGQNYLTFTRYHDYNDIPAAAIIALARKNVYGTLAGQGGIDAKNEARILVDGITEGNNNAELDTAWVADLIAEQQTFYLEARRPTVEPIFYQIRIAGNGMVNGEVGHLIAPYFEDQAPEAEPPIVPH